MCHAQDAVQTEYSVIQAEALRGHELTIQWILQQYEESPDKLVGLCHAGNPLLLCSGLQAIALVLIRAEGRVYDVQLPFACLTHHSYQLYTVYLQEQGTASWLLQCQGPVW